MKIKHSDNTLATLEEKLRASDNSKLIETLLNLYESNEEVRKKIDIVFADMDKASAKMVCAIKKEISALENSVRFIDYDETSSVAEELDRLRLKIVNEIYNKSPQIAFDLMLEFLDAHNDIFNRVFDDNGIVLEVFMQACKDLARIAQSIPHLSLEKKVDVIFFKWMKNEFGIYDDLIADFKDVLKDEGFTLLEDKLKQALDTENEWCIKRGLKEIADCKDNVDAFIQACSFADEVSEYDHFDIAKRLIKHNRGKEALEWLDRISISKSSFWQKDKSLLRIQAFEVQGECEKAQNERMSLFSKILEVGIYNDILRHEQSLELKKSFKVEAIEKAFIFEPHKALSFLIEIQELEQAGKLVHLRHNEFDGDRSYILKQAADLLSAIDSAAATLLYRVMIEFILKKGSSKYYEYGVKYLVKCRDLNSRIFDWGSIKKHDDYFNDLCSQYKLKRSFWSRYQSAL